MNVFFDTSVLIPALVDQLQDHEASFQALVEYTQEPHSARCSTHSLAECYSVLTALPLKRRITSAEAERIVTESIGKQLHVQALSAADYLAAIAMVADRGLTSGAVYDALHVVAATRSKSRRILTYNVRHFRALAPSDTIVSTP